MTVARDSLTRELAHLEARLRNELRAELDRRILELWTDLNAELEAITARIDDVHSRALRELTRLQQGGALR